MDFRVPPARNPQEGESPGGADVNGLSSKDGWAGAASPDEVRAQLDRLLASTLFRFSERLSRFLKFVVEQALAGNADQLKESVLAVEIFDRESTYDSRVDSVVRVEARRLREKLDKYYKGEGLADPVLIELPKGSYAPAITVRASAVPRLEGLKPAAVARPRQLTLRTVGLAVGACILATIVLTRWLGPRGSAGSPSLERLTSDPGLTFEPALSSDGKLLAYCSDRGGNGALDIWLQQVPRGGVVRLTDSPADELEPAFSPDGTRIAYRQEGEQGGIYTVPTLGGKSTLLALGGYRPRFSPDGKQVAYWSGERTFRTSKVFVVAANGGNPVQLQPALSYAAYPVWSPDGLHLLFVGARTMLSGEPFVDDWDWWVTGIDGGPAVCTSARKAFAARGLRAPETGWAHRSIVPYGWTSSGQIVFAALSGDQTNIWRLRISQSDWQVSGPPEQLTFGAGRQDHPSIAADGSLVFTALTQKSDVWKVPLDPGTGQPNGAPVRVTSGPVDSNRPSISRDGSRLAFISADQVWGKDLNSDRELALTATPEEKDGVVVSPDGSQVAFGHSPPLAQAILVLPFSGGKPVSLCGDCGLPRAWLPSGTGLLFQRVSPAESMIGVVETSGRTTTLMRSTGSSLFSPSVSPHGDWLALIVRTPPDDHRVTIIPLRDGTAAPRSDWIPVTERGPWVDKPRWSARGDAIYYVSDRDGFVCLWMRQLDPATKKPLGEPKAVAHFHRGRNSLGTVFGLDLSAARDKLVFNLGEVSGNIWLAPAGGARR